MVDKAPTSVPDYLTGSNSGVGSFSGEGVTGATVGRGDGGASCGADDGMGFSKGITV